jgi:hypothetical protein
MARVGNGGREREMRLFKVVDASGTVVGFYDAPDADSAISKMVAEVGLYPDETTGWTAAESTEHEMTKYV